MKSKIFQCETITPMFLAGADATNPELRAPSIKGVLRFWWRAMNGHLSLKELHEKEKKIFGGGGDSECGRSLFSIKVDYRPQDFKKSKDPFPKHPMPPDRRGRSPNILEYLAYGTLAWNKEKKQNIFIRPYVPSGFRFNLSLMFQTGIEECIEKEIIESFKIFRLFGGLGVRSRNGFGSIYADIKESPFDVFKRLKECNNQNVKGFPSFSKNVRLWKTKETYKTWDEALAVIGIAYHQSRIGLEEKHTYKKRQYIGSPIIGANGNISILPRHAKPYFLKVSKEGSGYVSYILYLPSRYVEGIQHIKDKEINEIYRQKRDRLDDNIFQSVCKEFNDKLANYNKNKLIEVG